MKKSIKTIGALSLGVFTLLGLGIASAVNAVNNIAEVKAETVEISPSALSGSNSTVSYVAAIGSGINTPIMSNGVLRMYANNTLTISSSGDNISSISLNWTKNGNKAFADVTASVGSYSHPSAAGTGTWSGSASSVVFTVGTGQIQLPSMTVNTGSSTSTTVNVTGVSLDIASKTLAVNESFTITPTVTPSDASNKSITWTSTDSSIASVKNGLVSAHNAGNATIKATTVDGSFEATCEVTVEAAATSEISLQRAYELALAQEHNVATDSTYTFTGVVSALDGNSFFIQDNDLSTNYGIYVYSSSSLSVSVGNKVTLTSALTQYNGFAETKGTISNLTTVSTGNTVSPKAFSDAAGLLASNHNILCSVSNLTYSKMTSTSEASSSDSGTYELMFGDTAISLNVNKYSYTADIGTKIGQMKSTGATVSIVGAPLYNYSSKNAIRITNAEQLQVTLSETDSVSLDSSSLSIKQGGSATLTATASGNVVWSSNNSDVTVSGSGTNNATGTISVSDSATVDSTATITATVGTAHADCTVTVQAKPAASDVVTYTKVTEALEDYSGKYLIVFEGISGGQAYAFDGSLTTLDAASNVKEVTISDSAIEVAKTDDDYYFEIAKTSSNYSIKSASSKYIGATSYANKLISQVSAIDNAISFESSKIIITSFLGDTPVTLRYNNASDQCRFRYFKDGSSNQNIQLYKTLADSSGDPGDTPVDPETPATLSETNTVYLWSNVTAYQQGVTYHAGNLKDYLHIRTEKLVTAADASSFITLSSASNINLGYSPNTSMICIGKNNSTRGSLTFNVPDGYYVTSVSGKFVNTSDVGTDTISISYQEFDYAKADGTVEIEAKPYSNEVTIYTANRRIWVESLKIEFATAEKSAEAYATDFLAANVCGTDNNTPAIATKWAEQKNAYERADENVQDAIAMGDMVDTPNAVVEQCLAKYDMAVEKAIARGNSETIDDYMNRYSPSSSYALTTISEDSSITSIVTVVAIGSMTLVGGLTLSRKRKEF